MYQVSNFMKILPVGAELFRADRRTDMTKLIIVAFRNFSNAISDQSVMNKEIIPICYEVLKYTVWAERNILEF